MNLDECKGRQDEKKIFFAPDLTNNLRMIFKLYFWEVAYTMNFHEYKLQREVLFADTVLSVIFIVFSKTFVLSLSW